MGLMAALSPSAVLRTSLVAARAGTSASERVVRGVAGVSSDIARSAASLIDAGLPSQRRVWAAAGRAQVEVRGLDGPLGPAVVRAVEQAVAALDGVSWARVDVVTRRLVVRFDPRGLKVEEVLGAVAAAERAAGAQERYSPDEPSHPGDGAPVALQAIALGASVAGLAAAVAGMMGRLPALPGATVAAVVLVDNQPRLRRLLEGRLGPDGTDLALAASTAAVQGLTHGVASLVVDTGQRAQALLAVQARRSAFSAREDELSGSSRPVRARPLDPGHRPVPLPPGPIERLSDRAAAGSLLVAGGLLVSTADSGLAARALVIGAPRAARTARESFADTLGARLARRGLVVVDDSVLRRLDRVTTVVVDTRVLHSGRPLVVDAAPLTDGWSREHVWSAAQRLLWEEAELPLPPPPGRRRESLTLVGRSRMGAAGLSSLRLVEDGISVGDVLTGRELDPYADAVLSAARAGGLRLVLTSDAAAPELAGRADEVLGSGPTLAEAVRRLQADGQVVVLVGEDEDALAAADVGIGTVPDVGRVPWAADVLCGPGLTDVVRLLGAVPTARSNSQRGVTLAVGATFLGGLLMAVGGAARGAEASLPVTAAAASALVMGFVAGRQVDRMAEPVPILQTPWHALEIDEVLARIGPTTHASPDGVTSSGRVAPRRRTGGRPTPTQTVSELVGNVRAELADPLTPVLATGAAASAVIGSPTDALLVGGVLGANALISGAQRLRADRALRNLVLDQEISARVVSGPNVPDGPSSDGRIPDGRLADGRVADRLTLDSRASDSLPLDGQTLDARALDHDTSDRRIVNERIVEGHETGRDGNDETVREVSARSLMLGHIIDLRPGDVVPADARLGSETDLEVDEATLTGESVAVPKQVQATPGAELADRACMVYEGTTVLAGHGRAVVVAVGAATEAGRALTLASRAGAPAGMQARLEELTRRGLPVTLLGGGAVTAMAVLRGQPLPEAVGSGVSVAVAAVPEGLPLVATVAQLAAAQRLSQRGILVRSARTVEALGRVDTVCFDKTGTLTEGRLNLVRVAGMDDDWAPGAPEGTRVLREAARACPQPVAGEPVVHATDQAVLDAARAVFGPEAHDGWQEIAEVPFQSERGFSAALGRTERKTRLVVKGATEVLLPRCSHERDDTGKRPLDRAGRERATATVHRLAAQGLRVLAVARRNVADVLVDGAVPEDPAELAGDLTLLGFVALADVARPQAAPTIAALHDAGIATVMITGDHPVTARAIATGLGIPADEVVTGPELAGLDEQSRTAVVARASVFARVSPEQKLRIVAGLQSAGRVVAMTGDGANDAAAIRLADVGIGMAARGSTSARTAADLVLTTPDVSLILDALVEGRSMWRRVRDAVAILIGGNAGEVAFTLVGTALAGRAPIGTRQFLLVNMLTDLFPAMAVALAPTPDDDEERRSVLAAGIPSLGAPLLRDIGVRGAATSTGALAAWLIGTFTGTRRRASTIALAALVGTQLGQTLVVGGRDPLVIGTALGSAAALAAIIQLPGVSQFFGCTPLGPLAWGTVLGCAASATAASVLVAPRLMLAGPPVVAALPVAAETAGHETAGHETAGHGAEGDEIDGPQGRALAQQRRLALPAVTGDG